MQIDVDHAMCRLPRYLFPSIILAMSLPIGTLPRPPEQPEEDQEGEQEARFCRTVSVKKTRP